MMFTYKAKVVSVYDGDTITCLVDLGFKISIKEKFRLYGINTPEIRTKDLQEKKLGYEAKEKLEELIKDKEVYLVVMKKGKFGRWISKIFLNKDDIKNDNSVNQILLKEGFAKPFMID